MNEETRKNMGPGRAPQRVAPDKAYSPSKSSAPGRYTYTPQGTKIVTPPKGKGGKPATTKPKRTFSYDRPAGLMGSADVMERRLQANKAGKPLYGTDQGYPEPKWWEDLPINDGGGGGGGSARAYSDAQIAAAQARLQAIYGRFADDIAAQEAAIGQTYDTAGTSLGGIYDTSVGNINRAYDAARAAQTQQLLNLGMTEQTPVQSFGNQTASTTSLQNLRAAVLAQNEATRKASITNQRLASEAARRQGTESAAQLAAEMQQAMVSTGGGGGGGGGGGLTPYQAANLRMQGEQNEFNRQKAAEEFDLKSQPKPSANFQSVYNSILKANPDMKPELAMRLAENQLKY